MRIRFWALGALGVVLAGLSAGIWYLAALAPSGTGFKAQTVCSAVFVSGRDPRSLEREEFAGLHPLLGLVQPEIDRARGEVRAELLWLGRQKAVYRPGLGCILADWDANLPAAPSELLAPRQAPRDAIEAGVSTASSAVDLARLTAAIDAAFADTDPAKPRRTRALLVMKDGRLIVERYAPGFTKDMPLAAYSMTKTITGALIGILAARGAVQIDGVAPAPEWQAPGDPRGKITVAQLLHMTSGMHWSESTRDPLSPVLVMSYHQRDAAAYAASLALDFPPGEKFQYNSGSSNILARIARRAMNDDAAYLALPRTAIFDPAGMSSAIFAPDGSGTLGGATLVYATARDWVRFGELFLHDGARNGVQVLPKGWVAAAMTPTPASRARGYGAHIWINPERIARPSLPEDVMLMNGQFGQLTAVVPSRGVVIVRLGDTRDWDFAADPDRLVASLLAALP